MGQSSYVTSVLNGTVVAMRTVIPLDIQRGAPRLIKNSLMQTEMSVLVGVVGELAGRLVFEASRTTFAKLAEHMFGASIDGEMLESFVGELGNMIAGNTARELSNEGVKINISPPTVLIGPTKISGFDQGILLPVDLGMAGEFRVLIVIEQEDAVVTG